MSDSQEWAAALRDEIQNLFLLLQDMESLGWEAMNSPGIFFRVWDEYPVLRLKEACTLVGKSQQSLKSFTTGQMKNYMKRNRHQMVSYISCCKIKINLDFIPEAEIQARHLKNFVKETCVCVCVCFPHNLIVIMHLCAPLVSCAAFLKTPLTGSFVTCLPTPS